MRLAVPDGGGRAAGSIWGHLTEHGGGLTDAIIFGRIAGAEAAGYGVRSGRTVGS
jgi:hypothetical protein